MICCSVSDIVAATGCALVSGSGDTRVSGVAIDSRKVARDGLFVAFGGERVDGNDFVPKALEAGASARSTAAPASSCCASPRGGARGRIGASWA